MKTSAGYTLIEIMVVLSLIAIVTSYVLKSSQDRSARLEIELLKNNVEEIQIALAAHVRESCNQQTMVTPTMAYLVSNGLLQSTSQGINPVNNSAISFSIIWAPPIRYTVIANMGSSATANSLLKASGATRVSATNLVWDKGIDSEHGDIEGNRQFSRMFEGVCN